MNLVHTLACTRVLNTKFRCYTCSTAVLHHVVLNLVRTRCVCTLALNVRVILTYTFVFCMNSGWRLCDHFCLWSQHRKIVLVPSVDIWKEATDHTGFRFYLHATAVGSFNFLKNRKVGKPCKCTTILLEGNFGTSSSPAPSPSRNNT